MPIPQPNLYPPFNVVRLSHVEFVVKDLAASRAYLDRHGTPQRRADLTARNDRRRRTLPTARGLPVEGRPRGECCLPPA